MALFFVSLTHFRPLAISWTHVYCSVVLAAHHYYAVVQSKKLGGRADSSGSDTIVSLILNFDRCC